ncbi:protein-tyrosine phosphatase [Dokdonia sp. Hel_I_63]|uniref:tyrosine-protein phosphatase n=1 Tax=Dokdonia sp. Hel_I_63 TaxID=1249996 RepID=UPI00119B5795|nr:CpsB/CapC family capsule biosynthesis tyrosine phosphatase [Dokdonia sp. Hel_I_63]TVZ23014.1 protein-tyrosine phosphatase [Dokdonia sp. Hel_I_63]
MFGIFNKKKSFLDIWSGTPEMHCHVLPGIDDGAKTVAHSEELLRKYKSLGCDKIIATPHTMGGIYDNTPATILNAYNSIKETQGIDLSYSSEYMLDEVFTTYLEKKELIPLIDNFVLVEMSFFQPPENLFEQIFKIGSQGYTPILAHPERYAYYHNNLKNYNKLKKMGCYFQLNALSLTNHYGKSINKQALLLLEAGMYDFIGTDAHRFEHLEKISTFEISTKYKDVINRICHNTKSLFENN